MTGKELKDKLVRYFETNQQTSWGKHQLVLEIERFYVRMLELELEKKEKG